MDGSNVGLDVFFVLLGAILVFSMHGGFAFLEVGTVRGKNQVNALVKIIVDFAFSTLAYFLIGYTIAYGVTFLSECGSLPAGPRALRAARLQPGEILLPRHLRRGRSRHHLGRHRRAGEILAAGPSPPRSSSALIYPFFEGIVWNGNFGIQAWLADTFGAPLHDFAGSIVVHAVGGWLALAAVLRLGARTGRYGPDGRPYSAVLDPVAGARHLAALHRLVRLQRHVGAVRRRRLGPRRDQLADGHGRRHPLAALIVEGRPRLRPQWRARRPRRRLRRLRRHAPGRRFVVGGIAGVIFVKGFIWTRTGSRSTTCSASGRCTASAASGAASPPASSASSVRRYWRRFVREPAHRHAGDLGLRPGRRLRALLVTSRPWASA